MAALLGVAVLGCDRTTQVRVDQECPSPSGELVATFYDLSGGGAAGWVQEYLAVRRATAPLDTAAHVLKMSHGYDLRLTWASDRRLTVGRPASARVDTALASASVGPGREVALRYEALPDTAGSLRPGLAGCVRASPSPSTPPVP